MRRTAPSEWAGFVLSLLLFALAWPGRERRPEPCADPVVRAAGEVVCAIGPEGAPRLEGPLRRLFGRPLDPNRADAIALETLPGIGPARAAAIIRERCKRPFASVADMKRVAGIGPKRIRQIEPFLELAEGLAPIGRASVKSGTCRSTCEDGGEPVQASPGCALP
jgi:hypothetical protein